MLLTFVEHAEQGMGNTDFCKHKTGDTCLRKFVFYFFIQPELKVW